MHSSAPKQGVSLLQFSKGYFDLLKRDHRRRISFILSIILFLFLFVFVVIQIIRTAHSYANPKWSLELSTLNPRAWQDVFPKIVLCNGKERTSDLAVLETIVQALDCKFISSSTRRVIKTLETRRSPEKEVAEKCYEANFDFNASPVVNKENKYDYLVCNASFTMQPFGDEYAYAGVEGAKTKSLANENDISLETAYLRLKIVNQFLKFNDSAGGSLPSDLEEFYNGWHYLMLDHSQYLEITKLEFYSASGFKLDQSMYEISRLERDFRYGSSVQNFVFTVQFSFLSDKRYQEYFSMDIITCLSTIGGIGILISLIHTLLYKLLICTLYGFELQEDRKPEQPNSTTGGGYSTL